MKKIFLLITILFVSVVSTACINNLAVQELNNKAKEYIANGETEKAICRLRSSIDLDDSIFETHYNLGVALIEGKKYEEAKESLENAIKLKPDFAESYYSLAVAFEHLANEITTQNTDEEKEIDEDSANNQDTKNEISEDDQAKVVEYLNSAVENYNIYLIKQSKAEDEAKVSTQIEYLNGEISKYNASKSTDSSEQSDLQGKD